MGIRTIVVAANEELRNRYHKEVKKLGVECDSVTSLGELFDALKQTSYNGLLIDMATLVKADRTEKAAAHESLHRYPVLRLKWDENRQELRCLHYGSISNTGMSLSRFIEDYCRPFQSRKLRKHKRFPLHFNTLISYDDKFQRLDVERSTTLNISLGGCSLLTTQQWELATYVWLRFIEFDDQTPIKVKICRWTCWGTAMAIPSIGVSFESLTESQRLQLEHPGQIYNSLQEPPPS